MDYQVPIIETKLIPPRIRPTSLRRAKLQKKIRLMKEMPLTLVHAEAGYGKSTSLALFVQDEKVNACWYTVTSSDDDILTFLLYLTTAIQKNHPHFGKTIFQSLIDLQPFIQEEDLQCLSSLFINELVKVETELFLIIDDFHQIEHSYNVNRWMEILLEHIPYHVHLIISSRTRPNWQPLKKMKVTNQLLEITKEEFILSLEEAELLLEDHYGLVLNERELSKIYQVTEGWIIALGMIAQQMVYDTPNFSLTNDIDLPLHDLFYYLALEVFEKQSPMIQQFLEQTSVFDEMNEEICNEVLGITGSYSLLLQINEKNLFVQKIGEKEFRYHALFKEFLENQLRKNQPKNYYLLHEKCARYYLKNNQWETALSHYEKIGQLHSIANLLEKYGATLIERGKLTKIYQLLLTIPDDLKEKYLILWFLQGEVERYRSLYVEAEKSYEQAIQLAEKTDAYLEKSKALAGKAKIYLDTIQPLKAERLLHQAIEIREKFAEKNDVETFKLYRLLAENLINAGKANKAEKWIRRAETNYRNQIDRQLVARFYLRTGRLTEAEKILLTNDSHRVNHLPQSHRETDLLLSFIGALQGKIEISRELANKAIKYGVKKEAPFVEACGWMRMGHAISLQHKMDEPFAEDCYKKALQIMDKLQVERGKAEPLMGLCLLYGHKGEYERSRELGYLALRETEKVSDLWLSALITLSLGIAAIVADHFGDGEKFLEQAEQMFMECEDDYGKMFTFFWQSYLFFQKNDLVLFTKKMTNFLQQLRIGQYEFIFHKKTLFGPRDLQIYIPLLLEAKKQTIYDNYITKLLQELGLAEVNTHPGYTLRIQSFGSFRVWLGQKEVTERDWQRGKAKELFQLFITNPEKKLSKVEILRTLWPEQDEKSASRDFKVALNALHHALEPGRKARENPFFIIRDGSSYGINGQANLELDTVEFVEWIQVGLEEKDRKKAMICLENGLKLYKGEFLQERSYADWCLNARERYFVLFLRGAEKLAQIYVSKEHYDKAIYWCERIIEKDKTWEEAYRLLMYCYYRKNNRPFAMKWFYKCCQVLEEELGVKPLPQTEYMYQMILEGDNL